MSTDNISGGNFLHLVNTVQCGKGNITSDGTGGIKLEENMDIVFDKISEIQKRITSKKIADLQERLTELENELTEIINSNPRTFSKT